MWAWTETHIDKPYKRIEEAEKLTSGSRRENRKHDVQNL